MLLPELLAVVLTVGPASAPDPAGPAFPSALSVATFAVEEGVRPAGWRQRQVDDDGADDDRDDRGDDRDDADDDRRGRSDRSPRDA